MGIQQTNAPRGKSAIAATEVPLSLRSGQARRWTWRSPHRVKSTCASPRAPAAKSAMSSPHGWYRTAYTACGARSTTARRARRLRWCSHVGTHLCQSYVQCEQHRSSGQAASGPAMRCTALRCTALRCAALQSAALRCAARSEWSGTAIVSRCIGGACRHSNALPAMHGPAWRQAALYSSRPDGTWYLRAALGTPTDGWYAAGAWAVQRQLRRRGGASGADGRLSRSLAQEGDARRLALPIHLRRSLKP